MPRELEEYARLIHKNTEMYSTYDADTLLAVLDEMTEVLGAKMDVADDKYKVKLNIAMPTGTIEMKVRILKVKEGLNCLEFSRVSGDQLEFFTQYNQIKDFYGEFNNAAYQE